MFVKLNKIDMLLSTHLREPQYGETNTGKSETIPDQSLTIKEILNRYAKGLPLGGEKIPLYDDEDLEISGFRNFDKLDLADQQTLRENARAEVESIQRKMQEIQAIRESQKQQIQTETQ